MYGRKVSEYRCNIIWNYKNDLDDLEKEQKS